MGRLQIMEVVQKEKIKEDKNAANEFDIRRQINECVFSSNSLMTMMNNAHDAFEWPVCCSKHYIEDAIFVFDPGGGSLADVVE